MEWLIKAMHELQGRPELFDKNGRIGADILGHAPVTVRNIGTGLQNWDWHRRESNHS